MQWSASRCPPQLQISNGYVRANVYLPDREHGFYRGTRFDWSGVISGLECHGHQYHDAWYTQFDPSMRDFVFRGSEIVAGPQSAITGPAEEFVIPQRYAGARIGETFVKVGVGILRKPDESEYSCYNRYELVDTGTWSTHADASSVEFTQDLFDAASGVGYAYRKTIKLSTGLPELSIEHNLRNTGRIPIRTTQYNHNFLTLDRAVTGPDFVICLPFQIQATEAMNPQLAEIRGNQIAYLNSLQESDVASFPISGFGKSAGDYDIRIENKNAGAGVRITADQPLAAMVLWSIRSVLSVEPFIDISVAPGATSTWTYTYAYYVV